MSNELKAKCVCHDEDHFFYADAVSREISKTDELAGARIMPLGDFIHSGMAGAREIAHAPTCPVAQPGFVPDLNPAVSRCDCDFMERLAAELAGEAIERLQATDDPIVKAQRAIRSIEMPATAGELASPLAQKIFTATKAAAIEAIARIDAGDREAAAKMPSRAEALACLLATALLLERRGVPTVGATFDDSDLESIVRNGGFIAQ